MDVASGCTVRKGSSGCDGLSRLFDRSSDAVGYTPSHHHRCRLHPAQSLPAASFPTALYIHPYALTNPPPRAIIYRHRPAARPYSLYCVCCYRKNSFLLYFYFRLLRRTFGPIFRLLSYPRPYTLVQVSTALPVPIDSRPHVPYLIHHHLSHPSPPSLPLSYVHSTYLLSPHLALDGWTDPGHFPVLVVANPAHPLTLLLPLSHHPTPWIYGGRRKTSSLE